MENYHKHSWFTNTLVSDCATSYENYLARNLELGNHVISSVEHGFQSNYYVPYEIVMNHNEKIKKQLEEGLISEEDYNKKKQKFIFGTEAYWVKDRKKEYLTGIDEKTGKEKYAKDRTNCHIVILAKNEEGRQDINEVLSDANVDGYYFQPRLDLELLMRIKPENVMVTTACLKYWVYDDIEEITVKLHNHFKDNFFLEVQYHNTEVQKNINRRILELSHKYGIDIICGLDSHYIYPEDKQERDNYLKGRGIKYNDDEIGWYMDYPSDDNVIKRLKEQGILNEEEITRSMKNTELLLDFDDLYFNKDIKLPSIYPDKSQDWKNKKLEEEVWNAWEKEKSNVPIEKHKEYEEGINYELSAILNTGMADYFLLDKAIVERGISKGGIVTKTGRGSGVSYYMNSLLGFSNIDRFISPVRLYPDRFLSETRILKTRSLPDLDLNLGNPEVFAEAQVEVMTEAYHSGEHAYPMISYKPLQKSSAFKLYAKSQGFDYELANEVTAQIKAYEKALKHADSPEDKEAINIYDFVDKTYHKYLDESKKYQGIINAKSQAPCFTKDHFVMTDRGYKYIQNINIGDYVLTHENRFNEVVFTNKKMSDDLYDIHITGDSIIATGDHPFYVITKKIKMNKNIWSKPQWKNANCLSGCDYVGFSLNEASIIPKFNASEFIEPEHRFNESYDLKFDNENFWWIVGRYIGDGWVNSYSSTFRVIICCSKKNNEIKDVLERIPYNMHYYISEERTVYKITFNNKVFVKYLERFGSGAKNKHLTSDIFNLPNNFLKCFIDGYLSADGHTISTNTYGFTTISKELAYGIQTCIHKVYKMPCTITPQCEGYDEIEGRTVHRSKKYRGRFKLDRRKTDVNFYENGHMWFRIKAVSKLKSSDIVYNLQVRDDSSYTINNVIVHNCGYLVYSGNIKREIGLIKCKTESTNKEVLTTVVDGMVAENYKFVKNDLLKVDVWLTINKIFEKVGIPTPSVTEMTKLVDGDAKTWDVYANGATMGVNQCESNFGKQCCKRYKPQNIQELTALVAALRPGFKTQLDNFLDRKEYTTEVKALDDLLTDSYHYIMYQENIMTYLGWLGIDQTETYAIIKKISKKKFKEKELADLKSRLIKAWVNNTGNEDGFEKSWSIIEASAKYSFNASHSVSYAYDSVYGAYLKAHYPYEFYSTMLQFLSEKGDKDKISLYKNEMREFFGIEEGKYQFRKDNRTFASDEDNKCIYPAMESLKGFSRIVSEDLFQLGKSRANSFVDMLLDLKSTTSVNNTQLDSLIKVDYFAEFGSIGKLLKINEIFGNVYDKTKKCFKKQMGKDKVEQSGLTHEAIKAYCHKETDKTYMQVDFYGLIKDIESNVPFIDISDYEKASYQQTILKHVSIIDKKYKGIAVVSAVDTKYSPKITCFALANGNTIECKIDKRTYSGGQLEEGDVIEIKDTVAKPRQTKNENGKWVNVPGTKVYWITGYRILFHQKKEK